MGLDWRWAPGASRALRRATNEDNFELPTYSAPERRAGAKNLPTYFWLPPVQSYVGRKKTKRWKALLVDPEGTQVNNLLPRAC